MSRSITTFKRGNKVGLNKRFSVQNQPKNRGRKSSFYAKAQKESKGGINRKDFIYILQWILERPIGELEELSQRKDLPMWMIEYITAILKDTVLERFNTVNYAFDMIFGKDRGSKSVNIKVKRSQKNRK